MTIHLPQGPYEPRATPLDLAPGTGPLSSRTVFSAAHVVADPYADISPDSCGRRRLGRHSRLPPPPLVARPGRRRGDGHRPARHGPGLGGRVRADPPLRRRGEAVGGRIACGVGTDQLTGPATLAEVRSAYEEQLALVEESGAQAILMASRALAAVAKGPEDYLETYAHLLRQASEPVVLHWLGPMFDPALDGYWGSSDLDTATDTFLKVIAEHPDKVDGIKISLLDAAREIDVRRRLPGGVRCYTGDDFNYPELIAGDDRGFSHALLGIFDPLGPLAAHAVRVLDTGDVQGFRDLLDPTVELSRHLFQTPTRFYKAGVVLLAWLVSHQDHFTMVGGLQSARSLPHLAKAYELADRLGLFPDPELAESRMRTLLAVNGGTR